MKKLTKNTLYRMIQEVIDSDLPWDLRPQPLTKAPTPTREKETASVKAPVEPSLDPALAKVISMIEQLSSRIDVLEKSSGIKPTPAQTWGDTGE